MKDLIATVAKTYGGLHCAFNNAGILPTTALLADTDASVFDSVLAVDLKGVFLCMKYEIQRCCSAAAARSLTTASIAGMIADPASSPMPPGDRPNG